MVAQRRFLPLVAVVFAGVFVLAARLFQVQVVEAATWGREAANLVRSANVMPYHRGELTDRNGTTIARDEDLYQVQFEYREFRRGHPLAQVAHARSALELRAVPLTEALASLDAWALDLVSITPEQLTAFARGEATTIGGVTVPASADPEVEQRARRAADVRFYVLTLLRVDDREARLLKMEDDDPDRALSFAELVAKRARSDTIERERADLSASLASARGHLEVVASLLPELATAEQGGSAIERLVAVFEGQRAIVEDASADDLFLRATGFEPGRLSTEGLEATFDLRWIAGLLRWDAARLAAWTRSRRDRYEQRLDQVFLARMLARAAVEEQQGRKKAGARLLDALAELYAAKDERPRRRGDPAPSWTELSQLAVLSELDSMFEGRRLPSEARDTTAAIPLVDPELQQAEEAPDDPWLFLGMVTELARAHELDPAAPASSTEAAARWRELAEHGLDPDDDDTIAELRRLVNALEARFAEATDRALLALRVAAAADGVHAPLAMSKARLDAALQQEKSIQKDEQSRSVLLSADPPYELVHLLARFPGENAGLSVREATRRVYPVLDENRHPLARALIGSVRKPSLKELFAQIRDERRYDTLKYQVLRSAREEGELEDLNARLYRADEWTGGSGVEDYLDPELRGRFGWREIQGLAGREERSIGQAPEDGKDVELTLDLDLQRAAQDVIEHPQRPPRGDTDEDWFREPVGAIVLLTVDGEVLAAASAPSVKGHAIPGRDKEREHVRERTLTRPTFNPPGSVFKPFVAAFALDRLGFDASRRFACEPNGTTVGVYGDMHCAGVHHEVDMSDALTVSCNCYFAHVGEAYERQQLVDMAHTFGFDEPTGIKCFGTSGRSGLVEHWRIAWSEKMLAEMDTPSGKRRFANGLRFPEVSPMQEARAMAGLATGWLPEVTIVRKVDGIPAPKRGRELGISDASRAFVRDAMLRVVHDGRGSAHGCGLDEETLGFRVAAKTGSADYAAIRKGPLASELEQTLSAKGSVRKHTWVAGWFPAENPRVVFVVYLHDMLYTSTHTATWVAAQLLGQEAVKRWLAKALDSERAAPMVEGAVGAAAPTGGGR